MVVWGEKRKIGEGVVRSWLLTNSFLWGVLTSLPILMKIDQEMRPWECPQTDTHIDTLTDIRKLILSHAICYSYGTDNKWISSLSVINTFKKLAYKHDQDQQTVACVTVTWMW